MTLSRAICCLAAALAACSDSSSGTELKDGGAFVFPDSGMIRDASVVLSDAALPDTGPHVCDPTCGPGMICGCLDTQPRDCGCHVPQPASESCDPMNPDTCAEGLTCITAVKFSQIRYVCSDGSDGIPCQKETSICTTALGCVCASTPLGRSCSCQGSPNNSGFCDPEVPATCASGACVRLESGGNTVYVCSDGSEGSPCDPDSQVPNCTTTLGCTCPLFRGAQVCECSEPGDVGDLCDPQVVESCMGALTCVAMQEGDTPNSLSTRCAGGGGTPDAGTNPTSCDPVINNCPQGQQCTEISPGIWMCI